MTEKTLADLKPGESAEIVALHGGEGFQSRLRAMGLAEGRTVRKFSRIRWGGPIVVIVNRAQVAVGRGMAKKISVRVKDAGGHQGSRADGSKGAGTEGNG